MNTTSKIALAAALFSAIAFPAFASSQDEASVKENSGRIFATQISMPHAYASAVRPTTSGPKAPTMARDFQLEGR